MIAYCWYASMAPCKILPFKRVPCTTDPLIVRTAALGYHPRQSSMSRAPNKKTSAIDATSNRLQETPSPKFGKFIGIWGRFFHEDMSQEYACDKNLQEMISIDFFWYIHQRVFWVPGTYRPMGFFMWPLRTLPRREGHSKSRYQGQGPYDASSLGPVSIFHSLILRINMWINYF